MTAPKQPVSVIGLGAMGSSLAGALLDAGHPTTVWNRTAARVEPLVARGAHVAPDPAAAVAAGAPAIVCLRDDDAARAVIEPIAAALRGRVLVNLTSGSPAGARRWERFVADHGGAYLAGGILALPEAVGSADALLLHSGSEEAFRQAEPVLAALGGTRWLGRDAGLAPAYDMALQSGMYGVYAGAQHALALVASAGGDAEAFADELLAPWLRDATGFAAAAATADGSVDDALAPALQATGLANLLAAAEAQGVAADRAGHLRTSLELMRRAARQAA